MKIVDILKKIYERDWKYIRSQQKWICENGTQYAIFFNGNYIIKENNEGKFYIDYEKSIMFPIVKCRNPDCNDTFMKTGRNRTQVFCDKHKNTSFKEFKKVNFGDDPEECLEVGR